MRISYSWVFLLRGDRGVLFPRGLLTTFIATGSRNLLFREMRDKGSLSVPDLTLLSDRMDSEQVAGNSGAQIAMSDTKLRRRLLSIVWLAFFAALLAACGLDSNDESEATVATLIPTMSSTPAEDPAGYDESEEDNGGNVVTRSLRTGGSWIWSGLTWVWDRGSDGVNTVWSAINAVSGFIWDNVSSLPSTAWDAIKGIWFWVWGTSAGEQVIIVLREIPDLVARLNPAGLVGWLASAVMRVVKIGLILLVLGGAFFFAYKYRLLSFAKSVLARRGIAADAAASTPPLEHRIIVEVQPSPAPTSPNLVAYAAHGPSADLTANSSENWNRTQIRELRAIASNPSISRLFELARKRQGGPINYRELLDGTGFRAAEVGEHFSAFSRQAKALHKDGGWPIELVPPTDEHSGRAYFIPQQYLDWWFEE